MGKNLIAIDEIWSISKAFVGVFQLPGVKMFLRVFVWFSSGFLKCPRCRDPQPWYVFVSKTSGRCFEQIAFFF